MLIYVSPDTAHNQELRQCLSYFFPVYCYSAVVNQRIMQRVSFAALLATLNTLIVLQAFISLYSKLTEIYKELNEDEDMISPAQASLMIVDWTDPRKAQYVQCLVDNTPADQMCACRTVSQNVQGHQVDESVHIDLASDIIKALFGDSLESKSRQPCCLIVV